MKKQWYEWRDEVLRLQLQIQPRASQNEIVGVHGDALRIRITAAPVEDQANSQLIKFLAKAFGVSQKHIALMYGEKSRYKTVCIDSPKRIPKEIAKILI